MKTLFKLVSVMLMVVLLSGAVIACGGDEPAPTPPPVEPTPEPEPEPEPTPEPPAHSYQADIFGQSLYIATDENGVILDAFEMTSPDGAITIKFEKGTTLKDREDNLIEEFSATLNPNPEQPTDGSKVIGPTVTFLPDFTIFDPVMTYQLNYAGLQNQIDEVTNAKLSVARLISSTGKWGKYFDFQVDADKKTVTFSVPSTTIDYTLALIAETPKEILKATGPPENGIDIVIVSINELAIGGEVKLELKTAPNAHVMVWFINPGTGTRSSRPAERLLDADGDGNVTFEWELSTRISKGEGHFEFYATTSTDTAFLEVFDATRLETIFLDRADEIAKFQEGLIEQLELDDKTTLKMYQLIVAK